MSKWKAVILAGMLMTLCCQHGLAQKQDTSLSNMAQRSLGICGIFYSSWRGMGMYGAGSEEQIIAEANLL